MTKYTEQLKPFHTEEQHDLNKPSGPHAKHEQCTSSHFVTRSLSIMIYNIRGTAGLGRHMAHTLCHCHIVWVVMPHTVDTETQSIVALARFANGLRRKA